MKGREKERAKEKNIDVRETQQLVAFAHAPTRAGYQACDLRRYVPLTELNLGLFSPQAGTLSAEPNQQGLYNLISTHFYLSVGKAESFLSISSPSMRTGPAL